MKIEITDPKGVQHDGALIPCGAVFEVPAASGVIRAWLHFKQAKEVVEKPEGSEIEDLNKPESEAPTLEPVPVVVAEPAPVVVAEPVPVVVAEPVPVVVAEPVIEVKQTKTKKDKN